MASHQARNYLITGAGRGIGRGLTRLLLKNGHRVFLVDFNREELSWTAQRLSMTHSQGRDFETAICNLRDPAQIKDTIGQASTFFNGHLDVLINNAANTTGVGQSHLADLKLEDWQASLETNLTAPMLMSQGCLSMLSRRDDTRPQGGSIVHMSSTRAFMSEENNEPYSATKAGLLGLTQSMAVSLAPQGVRVNTILPGWINVANECKGADERGQSWEEGLSKDDHAWHLTGRVGKVEDVWRAVEYLTDAEFATGTEMVVDGGVTRKMVYPEE